MDQSPYPHTASQLATKSSCTLKLSATSQNGMPCSSKMNSELCKKTSNEQSNETCDRISSLVDCNENKLLVKETNSRGTSYGCQIKNEVSAVSTKYNNKTVYGEPDTATTSVGVSSEVVGKSEKIEKANKYGDYTASEKSSHIFYGENNSSFSSIEKNSLIATGNTRNHLPSEKSSHIVQQINCHGDTSTASNNNLSKGCSSNALQTNISNTVFPKINDNVLEWLYSMQQASDHIDSWCSEIANNINNSNSGTNNIVDERNYLNSVSNASFKNTAVSNNSSEMSCDVYKNCEGTNVGEGRNTNAVQNTAVPSASRKQCNISNPYSTSSSYNASNQYNNCHKSTQNAHRNDLTINRDSSGNSNSTPIGESYSGYSQCNIANNGSNYNSSTYCKSNHDSCGGVTSYVSQSKYIPTNTVGYSRYGDSTYDGNVDGNEKNLPVDGNDIEKSMLNGSLNVFKSVKDKNIPKISSMNSSDTMSHYETSKCNNDTFNCGNNYVHFNPLHDGVNARSTGMASLDDYMKQNSNDGNGAMFVNCASDKNSITSKYPYKSEMQFNQLFDSNLLTSGVGSKIKKQTKLVRCKRSKVNNILVDSIHGCVEINSNELLNAIQRNDQLKSLLLSFIQKENKLNNNLSNIIVNKNVNKESMYCKSTGNDPSTIVPPTSSCESVESIHACPPASFGAETKENLTSTIQKHLAATSNVSDYGLPDMYPNFETICRRRKMAYIPSSVINKKRRKLKNNDNLVNSFNMIETMNISPDASKGSTLLPNLAANCSAMSSMNMGESCNESALIQLVNDNLLLSSKQSLSAIAKGGGNTSSTSASCPSPSSSTSSLSSNGGNDLITQYIMENMNSKVVNNMLKINSPSKVQDSSVQNTAVCKRKYTKKNIVHDDGLKLDKNWANANIRNSNVGIGKRLGNVHGGPIDGTNGKNYNIEFYRYLLEMPYLEKPDYVPPEDLKSEVAGVYWDKRSWIASWYEGKKRYYKSFSAKMNGFYQSKFKAIEVRLEKIQVLNNNHVLLKSVQNDDRIVSKKYKSKRPNMKVPCATRKLETNEGQITPHLQQPLGNVPGTMQQVAILCALLNQQSANAKKENVCLLNENDYIHSQPQGTDNKKNSTISDSITTIATSLQKLRDAGIDIPVTSLGIDKGSLSTASTSPTSPANTIQSSAEVPNSVAVDVSAAGSIPDTTLSDGSISASTIPNTAVSPVIIETDVPNAPQCDAHVSPVSNINTTDISTHDINGVPSTV